MFDHLYALAEGQCIYSGNIKDLVPYLAGMDLFCPQYHNPADFRKWIFRHREPTSFCFQLIN